MSGMAMPWDVASSSQALPARVPQAHGRETGEQDLFRCLGCETRVAPKD